MTKRRNIKTSGSWRSQAIWAVVTVGILAVLCLAVAKRSATPVQQVNVEIVDLKDKKNLLNPELVLKKCRQHLGYDLASTTISELDLRDVEAMLNEDARIKDAQVYVNNKQELTIGILQKQPIVRVQDGDAAYYLDEDGGSIPLVKGHTLRVPIATGDIGSYSAEAITGDEPHRLKDLYLISKLIYEDKFLTALIEQIDVDSSGEFLLVPKVGKQELVLGQAEQIKDRFENLKIFYKEGMPKVGWRKFERLVLNWDGQVVGQR